MMLPLLTSPPPSGTPTSSTDGAETASGLVAPSGALDGASGDTPIFDHVLDEERGRSTAADSDAVVPSPDRAMSPERRRDNALDGGDTSTALVPLIYPFAAPITSVALTAPVHAADTLRTERDASPIDVADNNGDYSGAGAARWDPLASTRAARAAVSSGSTLLGSATRAGGTPVMSLTPLGLTGVAGRVERTGGDAGGQQGATPSGRVDQSASSKITDTIARRSSKRDTTGDALIAGGHIVSAMDDARSRDRVASPRLIWDVEQDRRVATSTEGDGTLAVADHAATATSSGATVLGASRGRSSDGPRDVTADVSPWPHAAIAPIIAGMTSGHDGRDEDKAVASEHGPTSVSIGRDAKGKDSRTSSSDGGTIATGAYNVGDRITRESLQAWRIVESRRPSSDTNARTDTSADAPTRSDAGPVARRDRNDVTGSAEIGATSPPILPGEAVAPHIGPAAAPPHPAGHATVERNAMVGLLPTTPDQSARLSQGSIAGDMDVRATHGDSVSSDGPRAAATASERLTGPTGPTGPTTRAITSGETPFQISLGALTVQAAAHEGARKTSEAADAAGRQALTPIVEGVLVRQAQLRISGDLATSSFRAVLHPQALGAVTVHVQQTATGLQVTLVPQHVATQGLLDKHLPQLVSQLNATDGPPAVVNVLAPGAHPPSDRADAPASAMPNPAQQSGQGGATGSGGGQASGHREPTPRGGRDGAGRTVSAPVGRIETARPTVGRMPARSVARLDVQA